MEKKPHSFCETPEEKCTMNYCDDNGCQNRKRELVNPLDQQTPDEMAIGSMNSELTQLRAENERLLQALRIAIKEKYQLSKREQSFVERMQNEGKPLPEQIKKRAMAYLKICSMVGSKVWSINH